MVNTIYIKSQSREVDEAYDLSEKMCEVKCGSTMILDHIDGIHGICFKNDRSKIYPFNYATRAFPDQTYT